MTVSPSPHVAIALAANGVVTVTINGTGTLNIIGTPVIHAVTSAIKALATRDDVRVLIVRGRGDKALIGGADISEMATLQRQSAEVFITGLRDLCESVRRFPTPTIARTPGWCLGGGLEVAMACDIRIASDTAQFGMPEVKVGIPSVIHATLLPRLIGQARARWLLLTGENINAQQALAWGLISQLEPLENLDAAIDHLASAMAAMGPAALRQQKRMLREWEDAPLHVSIESSIREFGRAFDTGEPQRYMGAFLARKSKHKPA